MLGALSLAAVIAGLVLLVFGLIPSALFDVIFALAMGNTVLAMLPRIGVDRRTALMAAIAVPLAAIGAMVVLPDVRLAPYLAVVLINAFVAYAFGRGLSAGRTPLIVQLIRVSNSGPEGPPEFQRYVRGQGWVWTAFGAVTAICGLLAMLFAGLRPWLDPAITVLLVLQVVWFVLAHHWARLRHKRPETWIGTVRIMARPATWSELQI